MEFHFLQVIPAEIPSLMISLYAGNHSMMFHYARGITAWCFTMHGESQHDVSLYAGNHSMMFHYAQGITAWCFALRRESQHDVSLYAGNHSMMFRSTQGITAWCFTMHGEFPSCEQLSSPWNAFFRFSVSPYNTRFSLNAVNRCAEWPNFFDVSTNKK